MLVIVLLALSGLFYPSFIYCQDSLLQSFADVENDYDDLAEWIAELKEHPLDINKASITQWKQIPFITEAQISAILKYRSKNSGPLTTGDIKKILGTATFQLIQSFIHGPSPLEVWKMIYSQSVRSSHPRPPEIIDNSYAGNELAHTSRLRFHYGERWQCGLIMAKDPGERNYSDRLAGFLNYSTRSFRIIIGDFVLYQGQGLLYANPYTNRQSSLATLSFRQGISYLKHSLSRSGLSSQTGIAMSYAPASFLELIGTFSLTKHDVVVDSESNVITGIKYNTYHRTDREIENAHRLKETIHTVILNTHHGKQIHLSFLMAQVLYDPPVQHTVSTVGSEQKRRTFYSFSGRRIYLFSSSYSSVFRNIHYTGELARSAVNRRESQYWAGSSDTGIGISHSLFFKTKSFHTGIKHWYVPKNFQSPYGGVFNSNSFFPRGLNGFYLAFYWHPSKEIKFNAYKLIQKQLWRSYFNPLPLQKSDWFIAFDYHKFSNHLHVRLRQTQNQSYSTTRLANTHMSIALSKQLRTELLTKLNKTLTTRFRWEQRWIKNSPGLSTNVFQDLRIHLDPAFYINLRISFFKTHGYAYKIYEYESDLPYTFSNYPLYGDGKKYSILLRYRPWNKISFWFKYRFMKRFDDGQKETKQEFKIMFRWRIGNN